VIVVGRAVAAARPGLLQILVVGAGEIRVEEDRQIGMADGVVVSRDAEPIEPKYWLLMTLPLG